MPGFRRPVHVEGRVEGRGAGVAREVGVGAAREEFHREIEMSVDHRDEQRGRVVRGAPLVDVRTRVKQNERRVAVAFAGREQQRRQPAVRADEVGVVAQAAGAGGLLGVLEPHGLEAGAGPGGRPGGGFAP